MATYLSTPAVTIDNTSPTTLGASGNSTITWHADENGSYSVRVGGTNCTTGTQVASGNYNTQPNTTTSTVNASALSEGANTIRVCVTNSINNTGFATTTVTKDTTAPTVQSITRIGPATTNAPNVLWQVTFSEPVLNVNITGSQSDFTLANTGLGGTPAITSLGGPPSGPSAVYTVSASTGTGSGSLGLNLNDNDSITDALGNKLGGTGTGTAVPGGGAGNGSKVGDVFTIDRTAPIVLIDSTSPSTINGTGSSTITWHANENGSYSVRVGGTNCSTGTQVASGNYTTQPNTVTTTVNAADLASGSNTVRVCVTDGVGPSPNTGSATTTITYNPNSPPSANANGPYDVNEGGSVQLSGSGSDPDAGDTLTYAWDFNYDGNTFDTDSTSASPSFSAANIDGPATRTVALRVTDNHGAQSSVSTTTVNIKNVPPTATFNAPSSVNQGEQFQVSLTSADDASSVDKASLTYAFDCGSGSFGTFSGTSTANCTINTGGLATVRGQIKDKDGGSNTYTATVNVNSLPSADAGGPYDVDEGSSVSLDGSGSSDPDQGDTLTYAWDFNYDGTFNTDATGQSPNFSAANIDGDDTRTVALKVTDNHGAQSSVSTATVNIHNVAPSVSITSGATQVNEDKNGSGVTYNFTVSDPANDAIQSIATSRGAAGNKLSETATSVTCRFPDGAANGTLSTVEVTATDKDGGTSAPATRDVTVNNVAPTVNLTGDDSVAEGTAAHHYGFTVTDPGADTHTVTSRSCDPPKGNEVPGSFSYNDSTKSGGFDCTFPDGPATAYVSATVRDDDGADDADNQPVTVDVVNVPPTVTAPIPQSSDEGENHAFSLGSFADPGSDSPWQVKVDWGDGSAVQTLSPDKTLTGPLGTANHTYADNGTYPVKVTVTDKDGDYNSASFQVTVNNVPPSATFNAPNSANEGSNFQLSLTDVVDPGSADTHQFRFDCGSGFGQWGAASSVQCPAGNGPNTLTVKGQVKDNNGGLSAEYSGSVSVSNLAPTVTLSGPASANEGQTKAYTIQASDPGGDPITLQSASCDPPKGNMQGTASLAGGFSCTFPDGPETANVSVTVRDDDGATASDSKPVAIANVAPALSNLQLSTNATGTACLTSGKTVTISYTVTDPGVDNFTPSVNWGDGSPPMPCPATPTPTAPVPTPSPLPARTATTRPPISWSVTVPCPSSTT